MAHDSRLPDADTVALNARRADLRAFAEGLADHVMAADLPETFLDADRAVRSITLCDRFLQAVPPEEDDKAAFPSVEKEIASAATGEEPRPAPSPVRDPYRLRLRDHADKVMHAVTRIDKPANWLEVWRAQRYTRSADRMLTQLYTPPAVKPGGGQDAEGDDEDLHYGGGGDIPRDMLGLKDEIPEAETYGRWYLEGVAAQEAYDRRHAGNPDPPAFVGPHHGDQGYREFLAIALKRRVALYRKAHDQARASTVRNPPAGPPEADPPP